MKKQQLQNFKNRICHGKILWTLILMLTSSSLSFATVFNTYYVSATGSNSNSGTSIASAWLNIQYAIDNATSGDVINVLPGTYNTDEANSRDAITGGVGTSNFNIFVNKPLTIQGVTALGSVITNYTNVLAFVEAERNTPAGNLSTIYIQADNVIISGIDIAAYNYDPNYNFKTISVIGDNATIKNCKLHNYDQVSNIYMYDPNYNSGTNTSHIQSYNIQGNYFDAGGMYASGIRFSSGAGWTGSAANRIITGNTFVDGSYGIEFVGPGGDSWDVYPVGAATITSNSFSGADRGSVVAWGKYLGTDGYGTLDWDGIFSSNSNTFSNSALVKTSGGAIRYYDLSYNDGNQHDFFYIRGIYNAIQRYPIDKVSQSGDIIHVGPGIYNESLDINKPLSILGAGQAITFIDQSANATAGNVVYIHGACGDVNVDGFTIKTGIASTVACSGVSISGLTAPGTITISNNTIFANPSAVKDNLCLIAGYFSITSPKLVFDHNIVHGGWSSTGVANPILIERWMGPTEITNNSIDHGTIDGVSSDVIVFLNADYGNVTAKQLISGNTLDMGWGTTYDASHRGAGITIWGGYNGSALASGYTNLEISNNNLINLKPSRRGISLYNSSGGTGSGGNIADALITGNSISNAVSYSGEFGIRVRGKATATIITNNLISGVNDAVLIAAQNGHEPSATSVNNNSLLATTGKSINNTTATSLAATCNWYGSNVPATVALSLSGTMTYIPYLNIGTDDGNPLNGFQPVAVCAAPCALLLSASSTVANCPTFNDGTASVTITGGGISPYTYLWSTTAVTSSISGLIAGNYTVTVTDVNGCTQSAITTVTNSLAGPVHNTNTLLNYCSIQAAINDPSTLDGHTITIDAGTYTEVGQIVVSKNLTIVGTDKATTIIKPNANTGSSGDARAWVLVNPGKTLNLSKVTLDGTGKLIYWGIKHKGNGTIDDCNFTELKYQESGPAYEGTAVAIASTATVNVTNCFFTQIGRNGILADQCMGTYSGNTYTGKGIGDWLDYFILSEYGDNVTISNNSVSNCTGIASVDGSGSGAINVWDDPGTQAIITGNTLTNNSIGVAIVGINGPYTDPQVTIGAGNLFDGGDYGVAFQKYSGPYSPVVTFTGASTFKGQTISAISIDDEISAGMTIDISSAVFKTAGNVVITDNFAKEDLVIHAIDGANRGLLIWNPTNVYVTTNSFVTPFTTPKIQRGIDAASTGWTVNVDAGTFNEMLNINKALTLQGAGSNNTIIDQSSYVGTGTLVNINIPNGNVLFDGFKIINGPDMYAMTISSASSSSIITISNNKIIGQNASDDWGLIAGYGNAAKIIFTYNEVDNTYNNEILFEKQVGETEVSYNTFKGAFPSIYYMTYGGFDITSLQKVHNNIFEMTDADPTWYGAAITFNSARRNNPLVSLGNGKYTNISITDNTIQNLPLTSLNNWKGIYLRNDDPAGTGGEISGATINGNTINGKAGNNALGIKLYGMVTGTDISNNAISNIDKAIEIQSNISTSPSGSMVHNNSLLAASKSVNNTTGIAVDATCNWFGSTITANVAALISGTVTYIPWLSSGADASVNPGFQPTVGCSAPCVSISLSPVLTDVKCRGTNSGAINITPLGISPYRYLWNNGSTSEDQNNLYAGIYTVTVTDANGCTTTSSFTISQPSTNLNFSVSKTNVRCGGKATGVITTIATGGSGNYIYLWENSATTANRTNLLQGTYTVTITDGNGCVKTKSIVITQNTPLNLVVTPASGSATANPGGGVAPYAYFWNTVPAQTSQTATGLLINHTYKVKVTDSKGCTLTTTTLITSRVGSVIESDAIDVALFPNPTDGIVSLISTCNTCDNFEVKIFNSIGEKVLDEKRNANNLQFDLSTYTKGIYLFDVAAGDKRKTIKVVLE